MDLLHLRMLIREFLNKNPDIVPEEAPIIILDSKYDVCIDNTGEDTKNTRHISRRVHFVVNCDKLKLHNIDWCEGGIQFEYIATKNVDENDLNPRMKYIMVRLEN